MLSNDTLPLTPAPFEIFWEKYRQKIAVGIIACFVLLLFVGAILLWRRSERLAADALFANAHNKVEWEALVQRYPHSGAAANALLLIAEAQAQEHQWEASNATYAQFLKKFPHSPIAISAFLGNAMNQDAAGHPDEAINLFQQGASTYPHSYGAPIALMMKARLLARLGRKSEATSTLQLISSQYPESLVATVILKQELPRTK